MYDILSSPHLEKVTNQFRHARFQTDPTHFFELILEKNHIFVPWLRACEYLLIHILQVKNKVKMKKIWPKQ